MEVTVVRCQECSCKWASRCQERYQAFPTVDILGTRRILVAILLLGTPCGLTSLPLLDSKADQWGDGSAGLDLQRTEQDGEVDAEELQRCLTQSGISGSYSPFSLETCRIMISMLDRDYTGKMGFNEFKELWAALNAWKQNFMMIDQDRSGTVELHELSQVIAAMGYRLSPQTLTAIVKRYSKNGRIFFDDYVACCVKLRALTDFFRRRDNMQQGFVNFVYDDFLQCTMAI
uniref:EF-hand domain-containing protein n=1 Tax=Ornithorhynchus anatinus TaxID=9258 RepID=A0A6I8NPE8_ORNAN